MKRTLKSFCLLLLLAAIPLSFLSAGAGQRSSADPFKYVNEDTELRDAIGHYEYWSWVWKDIHRESGISRLDQGWNYYRSSLVDPIYEEAREDLERTIRLTSRSSDLVPRFRTFDQSCGTFEWSLRLETGFGTIEIPFSVPFEKLAGTPWPDKNAPYDRMKEARLTAQKISDQIMNGSMEFLFDLVFSTAPTDRGGQYQIVPERLSVWNAEKKTMVHESKEITPVTFYPNASGYDEFMGEVPFNPAILGKRLYPTNPSRFNIYAEPFGLYDSISELSRSISSEIKGEVDAELKEKEDRERMVVEERERAMENQARDAYDEAYASYEAKQALEDSKQLRWDEEFERRSIQILESGLTREKKYTLSYKGKGGLFDSYMMLGGGVSYPFALGFYEPGSFLKAAGSFMYSPRLNAPESVGAVTMDLYASGSILGIEEGVKYDFLEAYLGAGPSFSFGPELFPMMFTLSGGVEMDMDRLADGSFGFSVEPAIKCTFHFDFIYAGLDAAVLFSDKGAQVYAGLTMSFLGLFI